MGSPALNHVAQPFGAGEGQEWGEDLIKIESEIRKLLFQRPYRGYANFPKTFKSHTKVLGARKVT